MEPRVIGLIPDGNRRYAKKHGIPFYRAYMLGVQKAREALTYLTERTHVEHAYFYTLSLENIRKRSASEITFLFRLLKKELNRILENNPWDARISFAGRREVLPRDVREAMERVERETENNGGVHVILNIAYTGMAEIVDVAKRIARRVATGEIRPDEIDERVVWENTYVRTPPADLIVRTSGEQRLSGFLPIHGVYAELIFYPKLWPEMTFADFDAIFAEYAHRERRFGR